MHACLTSGMEQMYLAKVRDPSVFPHPPILQQTSQPRFNGSVDEFLAHYGATDSNDGGLRRKMKNKVKKCPNCGKPCAFTLVDCNSCATCLRDVPISFTDNVFTAFIFGIAKCPFPATISLRAQTPEYLVFDDLLALTPCHLNAIPTNVYCPDWRYLLTKPEEGLSLLDAMFEHAYQAAKSQFWDNEAWRKKFLSAEAATLKDSEIRDLVIAGMNYPPSQYQLHLQFQVLPLLPYHFSLAMAHQHYHHGRFFPKDYVRSVLKKQAELGCQRFAEVSDDSDVQDIISYFDSHGVVYDDLHAASVRSYVDNQRRFARWDAEDFEYLVVGSGDARHILKRSNTSEAVNDCDALKVQAEDKLALQGYGRPYGPNGKPSGTFYAFARAPEDLVDWTETSSAKPSNKGQKKQQVKDAFKEAFECKGGKVTQAEFSMILKLMDPRFAETELQEIFEMADSKKDGAVSYDKLVDWVFDDSRL